MIVYLNGHFRPLGEAQVSSAEHGLLYGDGLFETIAVHDGQPFQLPEHLGRLFEGGQVIGLSPPPASTISRAIEETIGQNRVEEGYLRLTLTRGAGAASWDPDSCPTPGLLIVAHSSLPYQDQLWEQGVTAVTVETTRRNPASPLTYIKSLSYLENIMTKKEAQQRGALEGLLLNVEGYLAEGAMSNLFLVAADNLITPDLASGLLPGTARRLVLQLALLSGVTAVERKVRPEELRQADEAFLTNSLMEVMPLVQVDGQKIGSGQPGLLTQRFLDLYRWQYR